MGETRQHLQVVGRSEQRTVELRPEGGRAYPPHPRISRAPGDWLVQLHTRVHTQRVMHTPMDARTHRDGQAYIHRAVHTHIRTCHTEMCTCMYKHTHAHTRMDSCTCARIHTHMHASLHMHTDMHMHRRVCMNIQKYTGMYVCMHMHADIHTEVRKYVCTCVYVDIHYLCACVHWCTFTDVCAYTSAHASTCTNTDIHTHTHLYIHSHRGTFYGDLTPHHDCGSWVSCLFEERELHRGGSGKGKVAGR